VDEMYGDGAPCGIVKVFHPNEIIPHFMGQAWQALIYGISVHSVGR